jgi:hypothetical protein
VTWLADLRNRLLTDMLTTPDRRYLSDDHRQLAARASHHKRVLKLDAAAPETGYVNKRGTHSAQQARKPLLHSESLALTSRAPLLFAGYVSEMRWIRMRRFRHLR